MINICSFDLMLKDERSIAVSLCRDGVLFKLQIICPHPAFDKAQIITCCRSNDSDIQDTTNALQVAHYSRKQFCVVQIEIVSQLEMVTAHGSHLEERTSLFSCISHLDNGTKEVYAFSRHNNPYDQTEDSDPPAHAQGLPEGDEH